MYVYILDSSNYVLTDYIGQIFFFFNMHSD